MKLAISLMLVVLFPFGVSADTLNGKVVKITDGDTLVVLDAGNTQHKIRLSGIDAPESNQPFGKRSKEALSALVGGQRVEVDWLSMIARPHRGQGDRPGQGCEPGSVPGGDGLVVSQVCR